MQKANKKTYVRPAQHQQKQGLEKKLIPQPIFDYPERKGLAGYPIKLYALPEITSVLERDELIN